MALLHLTSASDAELQNWVDLGTGVRRRASWVRVKEVLGLAEARGSTILVVPSPGTNQGTIRRHVTGRGEGGGRYQAGERCLEVGGINGLIPNTAQIVVSGHRMQM